MQLRIKHTTQYDYDVPVDYALQKVRLRPLPSELQEIEDWQIEIEGGKIETSYRDHYGNHVDLVSADIGTRKLIIRRMARSTRMIQPVFSGWSMAAHRSGISHSRRL